MFPSHHLHKCVCERDKRERGREGERGRERASYEFNLGQNLVFADFKQHLIKYVFKHFVDVCMDRSESLCVCVCVCVCVCITLRFGFMCGLYKPPGGCEQQSYSQLSNSICQNIRSITYTDSSGEKHRHYTQFMCHQGFAY